MIQNEPRDMNFSLSGLNLHQEYNKYAHHCQSLNLEQRSWDEWYWCTYNSFDESWRLSQAELKLNRHE